METSSQIFKSAIDKAYTTQPNVKINKNTIQFYSANSKWEAEQGEFKLFLGGSSNTILEEAFFYMKK